MYSAWEYHARAANVEACFSGVRPSRAQQRLDVMLCWNL